MNNPTNPVPVPPPPSFIVRLRESIGLHLILGLGIRILAILYSVYHDAHNIVKYTDIDYSVYTDGASYIIRGESPYRRETYRYTPLLAWFLTPNLTVSPSYGKVLFSLFDIMTSYLIFLLCLLESGGNHKISRRCAYLWIYSPLPIAICSRGSSESIILSLVLSALYMAKQRATFIAGLIYGFAVHFRIYPVLFCVPLYLCTTTGIEEDVEKISLLQNLLKITPHRRRLVIGSIIGFLLPTIVCYHYYGPEFLNETYLYHLTRKDVRHNFSAYFYMMYLNWNSSGIILGLITFLPQAILVASVALLFKSKEDLIFVVFVQTYCFVVFNKVCTSQYFLWYLSLVPVLYPRLKIKVTTAVILLFVWYFAQIAWLLPAYFLEFEGRNAFMYVWLESIAFFCANVGVLVQIIKNYAPYDEALALNNN